MRLELRRAARGTERLAVTCVQSPTPKALDVHPFWRIAAVGLCCGTAWAESPDVPGRPVAEPGGWVLALDNDQLTAAPDDRDYTGGMALTFSDGSRGRWWFVLDPPLRWWDRMLGLADPDAAAAPFHAMQFGLLSFTPRDIEKPTAPGDRPYASLVYVAGSRVNFQADPATVYQSTLTLGALGLDLAADIGREMHRAIQANEAVGWTDQISDGGEPTARYALTRLHRLASDGASFDLRDSIGVSAGYLTEVTAALSLRLGRVRTPWWTFMPDQADYIALPAAAVRNGWHGQREYFVSVGLKLHARLYNAFLQGQFRDSVMSHDFRDTRPLVAQAWLGFSAQLGNHYLLSWTVRGQTSELRTEPGDRDLLWGSITLSRAW